MDLDGRPPARDAAKDLDRISFDKRRRARNWALLAVLLGLAVLFYAITLVKMTKGG